MIPVLIIALALVAILASGVTLIRTHAQDLDAWAIMALSWAVLLLVAPKV